MHRHQLLLDSFWTSLQLALNLILDFAIVASNQLRYSGQIDARDESDDLP